jgi:hypothetical protein
MQLRILIKLMQICNNGLGTLDGTRVSLNGSMILMLYGSIISPAQLPDFYSDADPDPIFLFDTLWIRRPKIMLLPVPRGFAPPAAFPYSPDHTQIGVPDP